MPEARTANTDDLPESDGGTDELAESDRLERSQIKRDTAALYTELNRRFEATSTSRRARFLNFGYRPLKGEERQGPTLPPLLPNRDSAQLLLEVVGATDLGGRVVEVGCGRGGNLWLMHRYLGAESIVGVDLTLASLRFAHTDARSPHALFIHGDAESLPLADDSADVLLSLETSCCYPDVARFYLEVARVLRPGGTFLYADLMPTPVVSSIGAAFSRMGFERIAHRDISANVAESRDARAERQALAFAVEEGSTNTEWVGAQGTLVNEAIRGPENQYFLSRFRAGTTKLPAHEQPDAADLLSDHERQLLRSATHLGNELLDFDAAS